MAEPERTMQVIQVDERDSGWEDPDPRFRVCLHGSRATSTGRWTDTYDITGADVLQVIDWAQRGSTDCGCGRLGKSLGRGVDRDECARREGERQSSGLPVSRGA
jgi:hypothetical protein